jgi:hypothetical protein
MATGRPHEFKLSTATARINNFQNGFIVRELSSLLAPSAIQNQEKGIASPFFEKTWVRRGF